MDDLPRDELKVHGFQETRDVGLRSGEAPTGLGLGARFKRWVSGIPVPDRPEAPVFRPPAAGRPFKGSTASDPRV